jgi:RluA family pseudouridine synthase
VKHNQPFTIVYEDAALVVVNKAAGMSVTPDRFDVRKRSLVQTLGDSLGKRLFIVHRIDQDTSGLVVFAKNPTAHRNLTSAFEARTVDKTYTAIVQGRPSWAETVCDLALVPDGNKRHMTIVDRYRGKTSLTRFRLLQSAGNYSVVEAKPETGRTHQIRVHLAALGHSVVCDSLYGNDRPVCLSDFKHGWRGDKLDERPLIARLGLHATRIVLPANANAASASAEGLDLSAPLPRDMAAMLKQMDKCGV